tara:strand:- start:836 stop:1558 length:723 start_codon:yes stop_codon:yes gene_type:complete
MSKYSATQQANFAKNSDPQQGISLCIPRVFNNIGWRRIKQHIIEAGLGFVERVDVVPVAEGKYKRAFVHFAAGKWNMRDATARAALKALQDGQKIKLEYEAPWYWLVGISGAARPDEAPKPRERKTRIDLTVTKAGSAAELAMGCTVKNCAKHKGNYDHSAQQDNELRYAPKLSRTPNMNDPIVARAMIGTSPKSAQQEFDSKVKSGEMSAEELATVPPALRNFDEGEEKVEEGEISYER